MKNTEMEWKNGASPFWKSAVINIGPLTFSSAEVFALDPNTVKLTVAILEIRWAQILRTPECRGYYSARPCRAKSCNPDHKWCAAHAELSP